MKVINALSVIRLIILKAFEFAISLIPISGGLCEQLTVI